MTSVESYALVFFACLAFDFLWTVCVTYTARREALRAASVGAVMHALQGAVTIAYTRDPWCLAFAVVGGFIGVYTGLRWTK